MVGWAIENKGFDETFLGGLDSAQLEALRRSGWVRTYEPGTALFHERQHSDRVTVILSGRVKLTRVSEHGKEAVLGIRTPGELIGEMSALDGRPRSATAIALEPVEVLAIPTDDFRRFLRLHPDVSLAIIRGLSNRLRDADGKRLEFAAHDATGRVAARLVELAERFGEDIEGGVRIDLPISQEDLAGWTGCSREAVSKALGTMRELGWLETHRRSLTLLDLESLHRRAI